MNGENTVSFAQLKLLQYLCTYILWYLDEKVAAFLHQGRYSPSQLKRLYDMLKNVGKLNVGIDLK